jgi:hypothetical protein
MYPVLPIGPILRFFGNRRDRTPDLGVWAGNPPAPPNPAHTNEKSHGANIAYHVKWIFNVRIGALPLG